MSTTGSEDEAGGVEELNYWQRLQIGYRILFSFSGKRTTHDGENEKAGR
jgi:hypothetical protein